MQGEYTNTMENVEDNDVLRTKLRSCNILNTFYHETQHEIASLSQEILMRDSKIADLKARLGKYESTCIDVEGQDAVVIGPSKSLLENLCKEICKLKQKWKETEINAAKKAEASQLEIHQLLQQVREKEGEIEAITRHPDHEKDREIQQLRLALAEKNRAQATREVLCNSLANEADQLRGQLGATVQVCQELLARMESEKKRSGSGPKEDVQPLKEVMESSGEANKLVLKLKEENQRLKQRVLHVESLNSKWQKYDLSREDYVRGLRQRLKESGEHVIPGPAPGARPDAGPGPLTPASGLLHQEVARLNLLLEEKMADWAKLGDARKRDQERIQTLEQQVLIYIDDFKSERSDRERAQGRIQDLQEQVEHLKQQLHSQIPREAKLPYRAHARHRTAPQPRPDPAEPLPRTGADPSGPKRKGGHTAPGHLPDQPVWTGDRGSAQLMCPQCLTLYDDDHAAEYMNHFEECARL